MKNIRKILALALVALSVFALAAPALAETTNYVKVPQGPGNTVNVRNSSGTRIGSITYGSAVYVLGTSGTRKQIRCYDASTGTNYGVSSDAYIESEFLVSSIPTDTLWIQQYGTIDHKYTNSYKSRCEVLQGDLNDYFATRGGSGYSWYPLSEDGICGNNTVSAIKQFQTNNSLTADGVAGNRTKEYLYKILYLR